MRHLFQHTPRHHSVARAFSAAWLLIALAAALLAMSDAGAAPVKPVKMTGITVDLADDSIISAEAADASRWPASLAKLMTAYVAFEAMARGEIAPTDRVTVSKEAASQPPVKIWLGPGDAYPFRDLLSATLVASSNDAAWAVAEAVAGSEPEFVSRMNAAAEKLGLSGTRFVNPHGLPKPGQRTTARDIARLAIALIRDHPKRAAIFSARSVAIAGRRLSTTNPLFGRYPGAQGMKTGFTCRAGYNIVAFVERNGRRIMSVTLGARSSSERLKRIRAQLDAGFKAGAANGGALLPAIPTAGASPPAADLPSVSDPAPVADPPSVEACTPSSGASRSGPSGWSVFLGARANHGWAVRISARAAQRAGGATYVSRRRDRRWAAMLHGFSRKQAIRACAKLRRRGDYCITLSPRARRMRAALWR